MNNKEMAEKIERLEAEKKELLAALEFITSAAETEPGMEIYRAHLEQARAAIAKAKGETK